MDPVIPKVFDSRWKMVGVGKDNPLQYSCLENPIDRGASVSSVIQAYPALCDPMDWRTPGFSVHYQLLEFTQIHIGWWCHPTVSSSVVPFASHLQSSPASGCFLRSRFFTSGGHSIGVSASASVLPVNIQDWFLLGWTGWISLLSKGLSRVFSNTTVQKHQFFGTEFSL